MNMNQQTLTVLIHLAERCRATGQIKFDEFDVVSAAIEDASSYLNELQQPKLESSKPAKSSKNDTTN